MAFHSLNPINFESVSAVTLTPSVEIGVRRIENEEEYIYCYNDGGASITAGFGVILSNVTGYSVTVSSVTEVGGFFGIAKNATFATAAYGWMMVRGFVDMPNGMAGTAVADADIVVPAVDGKFAAHTSTAKTIPFGVVMSAGASGGTGASLSMLFVRCLGA